MSKGSNHTEEPLPLVSVIMPCFNHEKYLADSIESVLMQITDFPYELIISDDASSDGSYDICTYYADINPNVRANRNSSNIGLIKNYEYLIYASRGKYIAILESDDLWIDKYKLQRQIDFLESHQDYGLIHTDVNYFFVDRNRKVKNINSRKKRKIPVGYIFQDLLNGNMIHALTAVFNKDCIANVDFNQYSKNDYMTMDYPLWLEIARKNKVMYSPITTAEYRLIPGSISHSKDYDGQLSFFNSGCRIRADFLERENIRDSKIKGYAHYQKMILALQFNKWIEARNAADILIKMEVKKIISILIRNRYGFIIINFLFRFYVILDIPHIFLILKRQKTERSSKRSNSP